MAKTTAIYNLFLDISERDFEIVVSGDHPIPEYLLNVDYKVKTDLKVLSTGEKYKVLVSLYMISPQWVHKVYKQSEGHETTAYFFKKLACQNTRMVYSLGAYPETFKSKYLLRSNISIWKIRRISTRVHLMVNQSFQGWLSKT